MGSPCVVECQVVQAGAEARHSLGSTSVHGWGNYPLMPRLSWRVTAALHMERAEAAQVAELHLLFNRS